MQPIALLRPPTTPSAAIPPPFTPIARWPMSYLPAPTICPITVLVRTSVAPEQNLTSDFVYARLQKGDDSIKTGYPSKALDAWAGRLETWAAGGEPADLPRVEKKSAPKQPRDVFAYVIHEGKVRAPAAAMELIKRQQG